MLRYQCVPSGMIFVCSNEDYLCSRRAIDVIVFFLRYFPEFNSSTHFIDWLSDLLRNFSKNSFKFFFYFLISKYLNARQIFQSLQNTWNLFKVINKYFYNYSILKHCTITLVTHCCWDGSMNQSHLMHVTAYIRCTCNAYVRT